MSIRTSRAAMGALDGHLGIGFSIDSKHLAEIDRKAADHSALRAEFGRVIAWCGRGTVKECNILESLGPRANG